jgi:hypothetical protein
LTATDAPAEVGSVVVVAVVSPQVEREAADVVVPILDDAGNWCGGRRAVPCEHVDTLVEPST